MPKINVKLKDPNSSVNIDKKGYSGKDPFEVEETDQVKKAIKGGILVRVSTPENTSKPTESKQEKKPIQYEEVKKEGNKITGKSKLNI